MSDDSETVVDTKKSSLAEVTDDSYEAVPLDRPSDDYNISEFIYQVIDVNPESLQEKKQEPDDRNDNGDSHYYVKQEQAEEYDSETMQVSFACIDLTDFVAIIGL